MKNIKTLLFVFVVFCITVNTLAQDKFYATTPLKDAKKIKTMYPNQVQILGSKDGEAAVYITKYAAEELHHNVVVHGPGYIYEESAEEAMAAIYNRVAEKAALAQMAGFTIDQQAFVSNLLGNVSAGNIKNQILQLEDYGTRYHTKQKAKDAANDLKSKWQDLSGGRADVTVKLFQHSGTTMPSVIFSIQGSENANEIVVLGGHLDSTSSNKNDCPGADDNASGISTITEIIRVLMQANFKPKRTVEFMAFAAEEVGLVGSKEIAKNYKNNNKEVFSMMQLDMTNYKGSSSDMAISNDSYNSSELNQFLKDLIAEYNASGTHKITYSTTKCNYGCSDHYSFAQQGFRVAFPFEANFNQSNSRIHTANDKFIYTDQTAAHSARFAKLGLEYVVEAAKHNGASSSDSEAPTVPTNLTASNVTSTSVDLSWNTSSDNVGVVGYRIYNNGQSVATTSTTNYTVSGLSPNTQYSFTVSAYDAANNNSSQSNSVSITTKEPEPCAGDFVLKLVTDNYPEDISWTVKNDAGVTILSGGNYTEKNKTYTIEECLPIDCYKFELKDSYGDGICCNSGSGSFSLSINGNEIASGGDYGSGTTKDFCVSQNTPDTEAPSVPTNLSTSNITANSATISWSASTDNVKVDGYEVYQNNVLVGSATSTSYTANGLASETTYQFSVLAKDSAGNKSVKSSSISVTTKEDVVTYCALKGNNTNYEWIDYVALSNMINASEGDNGYKDYTAKIADISYGNETISLSAGFRNSSYKENWFVWIDFNQDGTFSESEKVVTGSSSNGEIFQESFTVPSTSKLGITRMRVAMVYNSSTSACGTFSYGEVEDYAVNIKESATVSSRDRGSEILNRLSPKLSIENYVKVYPNPVSGSKVNVSVLRVEKGTYQLYNILGRLVKEGVINGNTTSVNLARQATGEYILKVNDAANVNHSIKLFIK